MSRPQFVIAFVLVAAAIVAVGFARSNEKYSFLIGDCPYYAMTAESLLKDGDFDLANQLAPSESGEGYAKTLRTHVGFFAISPDGRPVPKHSTLMPIATLPFFAVFGPYGFLVFNVVQVGVLVFGIAVLAGNTPTARVLALVAYVASPILGYTYNFSPDVFGAVLVIWAYVAATHRRWIVCGLLAGLAVWAKVYLAAIILPVGLLVMLGGWRAVLVAIGGAVLAAAPMLILNAALYGDPLVTGYDRDAIVREDGTLGVRDHYGMFNQPFFLGLSRLLFDADLGAVWTAPLWGLWPLGAWLLWRAGQKWLAIVMACGIVINLLVFACYDHWNATVGGNRFLFPAFALGYAVQGQLWELARVRLSRTEE
ncbi:MAG: hypothetical protein C0467_28035 [Planctomycetaceae bacterium]|nr:hypothetical protein [Planctomycetaceae bacterium]